MDTTASPEQHDSQPDPSALARRALNYFLPAALYPDPDRLHRARLLVATIFAILTVTMLSMAYLIVMPVPETSRIIGIPIEIVVVLTTAIMLYRLRNHGDYHACSRITIGVIAIAIIFATLITGGVTRSPVAPVLVVPLLMSYFFGGIRAGNIITLLMTALLAGMLALEYGGLEMPQKARADQKGVIHSLVLLVNLGSLAALALVYEYTSATLRAERDEEHRKVVRLAQTDSLTGLVNRRVFDEKLTERTAVQHDSAPQPFALCYLDLNGFKPINDRHGHDVGDQVLRAVSIRLRSALRGADLIGRQGGDEFMLMLERLEQGRAAQTMATRFLKLISDPIETSAGLLSVGASLGFAFYPTHGNDVETLKKAADKAMYEAKRNGTGWHTYTPGTSDDQR